ncbi:MAG: fatty acid desaturase [Bacteroidota bacterium]
MRDRHLHIEADSRLLKSIHAAVASELVVDDNNSRWRIIAKFIFYFSISLLAYIGLYEIANPLLFTLCYVAYGFFVLLFAFNFAHDFSHGTIFKKPVWNDLGFIAIYTLNGAHAEAWKKRHIESHHFAPNVEHYDSDLEISSLIRVLPKSDYRWYHRFQHIYAPVTYTTYSLYWVFVKDFYIFFSTGNKPGYVMSFIAQKIFYIFYLLIMPLVFSHQPVYIVLVSFLLMHLCQSIFLLFTFFMTHHVEGLEYPTVDDSGHIQTSWLMNQVKSSNDMHPFSKPANFIFGGFNNHIAHHLFPHIHHIHYPDLNRILYRVLIDHDITPNQTSYWGGVCSHLKLLRRMGVDVPLV